MALLNPESAAGTIGGVSYKELPGSGEMDFTPDAVSATRIFRIAWADLYTFVSALTPINSVVNVSKSIDIDTDQVRAWTYPTWPGKVAGASGEEWNTRLIVNNISVAPSHGGKQKNINTSSGMITYDECDVTVTYGIDYPDKKRTDWQLVANEQALSNYYLYSDGVKGDQTRVSYLFPLQEFTWIVSGWKLTDIAIETTAEAKSACGKLNDDSIYVFNGQGAVQFLKGQVRLDSYETRPHPWFGRLYTDIIYRFRVCPGLYGGVSVDVSDLNYPGISWQHSYDEKNSEFRIVKNDSGEYPYSTYDYTKLVPWDAKSI